MQRVSAVTMAADRADSACQLLAANSIRYCSNNNIARRQVEIGGAERYG